MYYHSEIAVLYSPHEKASPTVLNRSHCPRCRLQLCPLRSSCALSCPLSSVGEPFHQQRESRLTRQPIRSRRTSSAMSDGYCDVHGVLRAYMLASARASYTRTPIHLQIDIYPEIRPILACMYPVQVNPSSTMSFMCDPAPAGQCMYMLSLSLRSFVSGFHHILPPRATRGSQMMVLARKWPYTSPPRQ